VTKSRDRAGLFVLTRGKEAIAPTEEKKKRLR